MTSKELPSNIKLFPETNSEEFRSRGYIYLLYDDTDEVVYVGQSKYLEGRIKAHYKDKPDVRYAKYFEVPIDEMNEIEAEYIIKYLPVYNHSLPKNTLFYSLDGYQKVDIRFYSRRVTVLRMIERCEYIEIKHYYHKSELERISGFLDKLELYDLGIDEIVGGVE